MRKTWGVNYSGFWLVSETRAANGLGVEGGAYTSDPRRAKRYTPPAAKAAAKRLGAGRYSVEAERLPEMFPRARR